MIQTEEDGCHRLATFLDNQKLFHLYEKFILSYYQKHFSASLSASALQIPWATDDENKAWLPKMQTDITLEAKDRKKILIIDAKCYAKIMQQSQYGQKTVHSGNLYQLFT